MNGRVPFLCLAVLAAAAPAAHAQLELFQVNGNVEISVPPLYDFGSSYAGETSVTQFRVRNTSATAVVMAVLNVAGAGFSLAGPALPVPVTSAAPVDFSVSFQGGATGSYSATLNLTGISVLLTATVAPSLTYTAALPAGRQQLGNTAVNFGEASIGSALVLHFDATNQTGVPLVVPGISLENGYFTLNGGSPSGTLLQPQQQTGFDVQFAPLTAGAFTAALAIGDRSYTLTGSSPAPVLPNPVLSINLAQPQSAQQGSLSVSLDAVAKTAGTGTVTLEFQPSVAGAIDSAIGFATGNTTLTFTFGPGDTQAHFGDQNAEPFQTGTSAGVLVFTASVGGATVQQSIPIAPASIGLSRVQGLRGTRNLTVQITGFDNTRTAGSLVFTFFDASGNQIPPGAIPSDGSKEFGSYFSTSELGGLFLLTAVFPVTGDISQIGSVEVQIANGVASTKSDRISF